MKSCKKCIKNDVCSFYRDAELREMIWDLRDFLGARTPISNPKKLDEIFSRLIENIYNAIAESCIRFLEGDAK